MDKCLECFASYDIAILLKVEQESFRVRRHEILNLFLI